MRIGHCSGDLFPTFHLACVRLKIDGSVGVSGRLCSRRSNTRQECLPVAGPCAFLQPIDVTQ